MGSLSPLLVGLLTADVKSAAVRARHLAIIYVLAGVLALMAASGLAIAAGLYLSHRMSAEAASLVVALVLLSGSLLLVAFASIWSSRQKRRSARRSIAPTLAATAAVTMLPSLLGNKAVFGLFSAAVAGYVFANRKPSAPLSEQSKKPKLP